VSDPGRWSRLERLFDGALDRPPGERDAWLVVEAGDDPELLKQLRGMLAAHSATGVLDRRITPLPEADLRQRLSAALAGRFELEGLLGSGGMSSVFRARELKHERPVVIKALQPGLAAAIGPHRFADEVRIAARLSHPHILALIDSGEADGIRYFVMPFVGGETLRARLQRDGALPIAGAITLLRDIADALAHAHEAGVVHRDLKPENVLCVGDHAFLLDFGVAKLHGSSGSGATDPGLAIGTPGYMAPEQAAGALVDHRADIYVWGLLAREILTGRRDATVRVPDRMDVPRTLTALVEAALAFEVAERPASTRALVIALDGMVALAPPRRRRWPVVAALAILIAAVAVLQARRGGGLATEMLAQPIAVAPLNDETGDSTIAGIGRLAGDWITQGLHEAGGMRVVAWPAALAAAESGGDLTQALHQATGAGTVVTGSIYRVGDSLRFQVEVVDARRSIVLVAPTPVVVPRDSVTQGVRLLRDRVMGALAVQRDDRLPTGAAFAQRPPTYAAYRRFDRALTDYNAYRYRDALTGMLESWQLDTSFTAALVYATYAAWNTSNRQLADSLVQAVMARREAVDAYHLAITDNIAASLRGDTPGAMQASRRATELAPGSRARYNLALSLASLNRPAEALAQLDSLDPDQGPMRGWPAYWSQRSYALHLLGRHDDELETARIMSRRHPEQRVAWVVMARALAATGRIAELDSVLRAGDPLPPHVYWSQGAMRVVAGEELQAHGHGAEAAKYLAAGERWLRARLAEQPGNADHQEWLIGALVGQAHWADAERLVRQRLASLPGHTTTRGLAAVLAARRGDESAAEALMARVDPWDRGTMMLFRARVAAVLGERETAIASLQQASAIGVGSWHWTHGTAWRDFASVRDDPRVGRVLGIPQ
jgi:tRNA A-37 threonylcarbamoyl transferase component Bud32/TolB-like protein/tetratricopeptide (TPR) repeat protein